MIAPGITEECLKEIKVMGSLQRAINLILSSKTFRLCGLLALCMLVLVHQKQLTRIEESIKNQINAKQLGSTVEEMKVYRQNIADLLKISDRVKLNLLNKEVPEPPIPSESSFVELQEFIGNISEVNGEASQNCKTVQSITVSKK